MSAVPLSNRPPTDDEKRKAAEVISALAGARDRDGALSLEVDVDARKVHFELPPAVGEAVLELLTHIARGEMVTLVPLESVLTTQEAADLLNVSRPFLTRLLKEGQIPFHQVGAHRRIRAEDLIAYKQRRDGEPGRVLDELQRLGQEFEAAD